MRAAFIGQELVFFSKVEEVFLMEMEAVLKVTLP